MKDLIVFGKPSIDKNDINEVAKVLKSGWIGNGPKTKEFEKYFKKHVGSKYAIAVNSCTSALSLSLKLLSIGRGDEVITTPITFASTANVIVHEGAIPVFADIDKETGNISPEEIKNKITSKTKAIIMVHFAGRPCEIEKIMNIARAKRIEVIEDCAHAVEAKYKKMSCGNFGVAGCFSFYPTKNITAGGGGMIVTNDKKMADRTKILSSYGINKSARKRFENKVNFYEVIECGYNYQMNDILAALGLSQLKKIKKNLKTRKEIWNQYLNGLADLEEISLPPKTPKDIIHACHLFTTLLNLEKLKISRNKFISILRNKGICTGIHFLALHKQPAFRKIIGENIYLPNAEYFSERVVSLPLDANLTSEQIEYIIKTIRKTIKRYSK